MTTTTTTGAAELPEALRTQPIRAHHPTVVHWRNNGIEACAGIADAYGCKDAATDMRAMLTAISNPPSAAMLRAQVEALSAAQAGVPADQVDLVGVRANGEHVNLGKIAVPPRMKAREIAQSQFGGFQDDDGSDAELCFGALEEFLDWLVKQGWSAALQPSPSPAPAQQGQKLERLEILPPNESGNTQCIVRWQIETPQGWVGAWNKEALEYLIALAIAPQPATADTSNLSCKSVQKRLATQWGYVPATADAVDAQRWRELASMVEEIHGGDDAMTIELCAADAQPAPHLKSLLAFKVDALAAQREVKP